LSERQTSENEYGKPACIIPAKSHSSRLPHKNKLKINGKPLYQYAIDAAKESGVFSRIWVSSDDTEILESAYEQMETMLPTKDSTLVTPHKRGKRLCYSTTPIKALVRFMLLKFIKGEIVGILTPCNPLITAEDIRNAYDLFWDRKANYVMSAKKGAPVEYTMKLDKGGFVISQEDLKRSQVYKPTFYPDGGIIFARKDVFLAEYNFGFRGTRCIPYIVPHATVDVDTSEDFEYAKYLLEVNE